MMSPLIIITIDLLRSEKNRGNSMAAQTYAHTKWRQHG